MTVLSGGMQLQRKSAWWGSLFSALSLVIAIIMNPLVPFNLAFILPIVVCLALRDVPIVIRALLITVSLLALYGGTYDSALFEDEDPTGEHGIRVPAE